MLRWRLPLGIVLIAALIGLFALDNRIGPTAPILCLFAILLAVRGAWEMVQLLRTRSFEPNLLLVAILCVLVVGASWIFVAYQAGFAIGRTSHPTFGVFQEQPAVPPVTWSLSSTTPTLLAFVGAVLTLFIASAVRYRSPGKSMETLGAELLILVYIGLLLGLTAQLRWVGVNQSPLIDLGYLPLASLIITVKSGDTAAYFFGHAFGKKKLAPLLSPGKTWAGAYGALFGSALGSWAWLHWGTRWLAPNAQPCAWYWAVVYGALVGLAGMIGDLCESLIKRDVNVKDSAPLLPGFGGLLDLLDSVIFAGPVAYVLWLFLPLVNSAH